jgi:hypothetical protein
VTSSTSKDDWHISFRNTPAMKGTSYREGNAFAWPYHACRFAHLSSKVQGAINFKEFPAI